MFRFLAIYFLISSFCVSAVIASNVSAMDARALADNGIAAYHRGDYPEATKLLEERARMSPEDPNVYYYLGNCYVYAKQNEKAAHMYSACVRLAPGSQAGKYALSALESLSSAPKSAPGEDPPKTDPALVDAARDSLMTEKAVDQSFNDAVKRIRSQRQTLKIRIDKTFQNMQDELQSQNPKSSTYATDLERTRREAENTVADLQTRELRFENRLLGPDKIDARAIPEIPKEKPDSSKTVLGSLMEYFKSDKPFDPFDTELTPEISSKFMTIKDVFGELSTYQPSARRVAKQVFLQLKSSIESKQDQLDEQLLQVRSNLIRDVVNLLANDTSPNPLYKQMNPAYQAAAAKIPRADNESNLSPTEKDVSQAIEAGKKRIKELEDGYYRDVDSLILGAKEKVGGMVAQAGQMNSQLKHPSGNIQLVPLGTDMYVRNYVNFGDRSGLK